MVRQSISYAAKPVVECTVLCLNFLVRLANPIYQQTSDAASTPSGYTQVLKSSQSSIAADAVGTQFYLGYEELTSYDVEYAANACRTKYAQCTSFNIYFERNPIQDPGKGQSTFLKHVIS